MRTTRNTLLGLMVLLALSCNTGKGKLVFEDNFDGNGTPDPAHWTYEEGYVRNNELQYYTVARPENCYLDNGFLHIVARNDSMTAGNGETLTAPITSASIMTKDAVEWQYGKVEVRAKLPAGLGVWPAIWMMPADNRNGKWPRCGEIDIMEYVGHMPGKVHFTIHTGKYNHLNGNQKTCVVDCPTASTDFHVYGLEWGPDRLTWYLDGVETFSVTKDEDSIEAWPFDQPFYLLINLAFGGAWGGQEGVDLGVLPQEYVIDYVRVYR